MGISILYLFAIITPTTINNPPIICSNTGIWSKNINDAITVTNGQIIKYEDTFAVAFFLRAFTVSRKAIDELNIPNQISPTIEEFVIV